MMSTQAGWWPVNEGRELGYFDGQNWTGDRVPNPDHTPARRSWWVVVGFGLLLAVLMVLWSGLELVLH